MQLNIVEAGTSARYRTERTPPAVGVRHTAMAKRRLALDLTLKSRTYQRNVPGILLIHSCVARHPAAASGSKGSINAPYNNKSNDNKNYPVARYGASAAHSQPVPLPSCGP